MDTDGSHGSTNLLTSALVRLIQGGLKTEVSWKVACGANVAYDQFPSQNQVSTYGFLPSIDMAEALTMCPYAALL
jgi:hypothetical protein